MNKLILKRRIKAQAWRVVGEISRARKREELLPLLTLIRDQGECKADEIADHLFFEKHSRKVVGERLLQIGHTYGLLENERGCYRLTDTGRKALESEAVFIPEQGSWTLWVSDDPLLESPILRIDPWNEPNAYEEIYGKDCDNPNKKVFKKLPGLLTDCVKQEVKPCAGDGVHLRIEKIEPKGEVIDAEVEATIIWDITGQRLHVEGSVSGKPFDTELKAPATDFNTVWQQLLEEAGLWSRWDRSRHTLLVGFDDTDETEREPMERTLRFDQPEIIGYGQFDTVDVPGVPLSALSPNDANQWARWRLDRRICDYATKSRFKTWCDEAVKPFPVFSLAIPNRAELAEQAWCSVSPEVRPAPQAWHLIAAEDWRL